MIEKGGKAMLKLRQPDYDEIRRHGEETYPYECCGVLLGRVDGDTRIVGASVRCRNTRTDSAKDRYEIDPGELVHIQRGARADSTLSAFITLIPIIPHAGREWISTRHIGWAAPTS
jgi:hypothetical protein